MALFVSGIKCTLCGKQVIKKDDGISFPAFVVNEADPLYIFNDSVVHKECFSNHPMSNKVTELLNELQNSVGPQKRTCNICNNKITNPDDYIAFGCMSSDDLNPLSSYNFKQYHKSCFVNSEESKNIKRLISQTEEENRWKGKLGF
jgi:hypothetical protein